MLRTLPTAVLALAIAGCSSRDGDLVHYVLPDGYRGPFTIIADGTDEGGYRHDGTKHIYTIPSTGVLHVTSARPMELFHSVSAQYARGERIPWFGPKLRAGDVRIAFFGASADGSHWSAVGNESEILALQTIWNQNGPRELSKLLPQAQ